MESRVADETQRPRVGRSTNPLLGLGRDAVRAYGKATAAARPDPEFLVIGAKRGGSTSLYFDLLAHPQMVPLFPRPELLPKGDATKGIRYFDVNYDRGDRWYRSHLPSRRARARQQRRAGAPVVTGEASPYYLFHPLAAERAAGLVPAARIVALLRDPVERTYSHWKERRRSGREELSFVDALAAEDDRMADAEQRLQRDPGAYSYAHEHQSYAHQSEYAGPLGRWFERYPDRVLVMSSEDYYRAPDEVLARTADFLGIGPPPRVPAQVRNAAPGDALDPAVAARLAARFAPFNERLTQLTGQQFPWR